MLLSLFIPLVALTLGPSTARGAVSVYEYPVPLPTGGPYRGWQAYDPTPLQDPPLPATPPPLDFTITPDTSGNPQAGLPVKGSFLGISIEMSLAEAVIGPNASYLRPQFLNLMSTVAERGGPPVLRCGGNTQEKAQLVESLPGGNVLQKIAIGPTGYTNTPTLMYTLDIIKAIRATSDLLGIQWFLGIPMNQSEFEAHALQTNPPRLEIVEAAEELMGEYLWGWQLGNEPDLYFNHNYRPDGYTVENYMDEFETIVNAIAANPNIKQKSNIGGPGVCCLWHLPDLIFNLNYIPRFDHVLNSLIIQHYPYDNCIKGQHDAQEMMNEYMQHPFAVAFGTHYADVVRVAVAANKPVVLLETNTASCNGFLGLSDAFAASLWAMDLSLQLAATNFSNVMLHLGGQAAYYNPFMSPPHNATAPFQWTVGPVMYSIVAMAEALGKTGTARVADLKANGDNPYTPAYTIYENNQPARMVFLNYMSDPTGAHDYTVRIVSSSPSIRARYMLAERLNSKQNITWAGQTFGGYFESDGLLKGEHVTETIDCAGGSCPVRVPGPSIVMVFLTDSAYAPNDDMTTFASSHTTKMHNTAAVDPGAWATSNGLSAEQRAKMKKASTSSGRWAEEHANAASAIRPIATVVLATLTTLVGYYIAA
ncbi:hypothetical protein EXIGLDRAFT_834178 [Exidia glandulosa HHB12029]|uniref:Beta-glucuronidase C-terminal domain-containing protein n=1 Tax=Exidia glandulosa HHB12029 TaxID=1314781 RepID=A0A165K2P5_EXIGL|nr:hypothetical protein EXIGLDRAFT_834178 [Exidia glandulosa HHB12029]